MPYNNSVKQYKLGDYIEFEGKKRKIGITSHGYLFFYEAINKKKHLHIYFWEQANGKHPGKGWHIHHKDENKFNNEISNLELLKLGEHVSKHKNKGGCVYFHKHENKWVFQFYKIKNKTVNTSSLNLKLNKLRKITIEENPRQMENNIISCP
jgi:hypothetical protein